VRIGANGESLGGDVYNAVEADAFRMLLTGNVIGMHATVVYNRHNLHHIGGFDATLFRCEDDDVDFRMAMRCPIASHREVVALYRWHGQNMSADHATMLKWTLKINDRQRVQAEHRLLPTNRLAIRALSIVPEVSVELGPYVLLKRI
jgi:hypothetical protein